MPLSSGKEDPLQIKFLGDQCLMQGSPCKVPHACVTMLLCTRATRACMHALMHGGVPYTPHA